jgi:hypothetical protein
MAKRGRGALAALLTASLSWSCGYAFEEPPEVESPEPSSCQASVVGVWHAKQFVESLQTWLDYTLTIRQVEDSKTQLEGMIVLEQWYGPETESVRGPCEGRPQAVFSLDAVGKWHAQRRLLEFHGTRWQLDKELCSDGEPWEYWLDHFKGVVDEDGKSFEAVINDGPPDWPEVPMVFRRQSCGDQESI